MQKYVLLQVLLMTLLCVLPTDASAGGGGGFGRMLSRTRPRYQRGIPYSTTSPRLNWARIRIEGSERMWEFKKGTTHFRRPFIPLPPIAPRLNLDTIHAVKEMRRIQAIQASHLNKVRMHQGPLVLSPLNRGSNLRQDSLCLKPVIPGLAPPSHPSPGLNGVSINGGSNPRVNNNF